MITMRYYKIFNNDKVVGYQTHEDKLEYDYLEELSEEEYNSEILLLKKNENVSSDEISAEEFLQLIEEAF